MIPDPDICDAALRACRRVNDFALAVRFIEFLKQKCAVKRYAHKWLMEKVSSFSLGFEASSLSSFVILFLCGTIFQDINKYMLYSCIKVSLS